MTTHLGIYSETVDRAACRSCGGSCCKGIPGAAAPEDFGAPDAERFRREVEAALRSGLWTTMSFTAPFVPMADPKPLDVPELVGLDRLVVVLPASKRRGGGSCVFWRSGKGCSIFAMRPTGCRTLRPVFELVPMGGGFGLPVRQCYQPIEDTVQSVQSWARWQRDTLAAMDASTQ